MSHLHVHKAHYGAQHHSADVKHHVEHLVRTHHADGSTELRFHVSNHSMGGDPAPGHVKHLTLVYSWGSPQEFTVTGQEGQDLLIYAPHHPHGHGGGGHGGHHHH